MLHTIYTSGLIALGQEKLYARVMLISGMIFLISIVMGILLFGILGAAVAMVISEAVTFLMMRGKYNAFNKIALPQSLWKIIVSTLVMGVCIAILPPIHVIAKIIVGIFVYGTVIVLTRSVSNEEVSALLKRV
jgi:O-antigen/teichoic acid export membrane protein